LKWWWEKQHQYPTLSQMAFDYLSIPGMSDFVDVSHSNYTHFSYLHWC
jgi:hypothetical protein